MIRAAIAWSTGHPRAALGLAVAAVVLGALASRGLARDVIPDLAEPQIGIVVEWPGHPTADVARDVTAPLTNALANVAGSSGVRGASMAGMTYLDVRFRSDAALGPGRRQLLERIGGVRPTLPADARIEVGPEVSSTSWVYQYALVAPAVRIAMHAGSPQATSLRTLRDLNDDLLRPALARIPQVAEVASVGGEIEQELIELRPDQLQAAGLAFSDVVASVRAALMSGARPGLDELGALPIATAGISKQPARLGDVARLRLSSEMLGGMAELDGALPVVGGIVVAKRGADVPEVVSEVHRALDGVRARLPRGVEIATVYDRAQLAVGVRGTLLRALAEEIAVVAIVVLIFLLHWRSALLPLVTLPVVVGLTFAAMWLLDVPSTVMSLSGIGIALGMAVDADLVSLDVRHRQLEHSGAAAGRDFTPVILSTLLIAAMSFAPAFAFLGEVGRLLRPLVITKSLVIFAAILTALAVSPAAGRLLVRGPVVAEHRYALNRALARVYEPLVRFALRHPVVTLSTVAAGLLLSLPVVVGLGGEFLPRFDEGDLLYMPTTSPDVPAEVAARDLARQDEAIRTHAEVASVFGKLGRAETATDPAPMSMVETIVHLNPRAVWPPRARPRWYSGRAPAALLPLLRWVWPEQSPATLDELTEELDRAAERPGWVAGWTAPVRARMDMMATSVRTPLAVRIHAADPKRIEALAAGVVAILRREPATELAASESSGSQTTLRFVADADALGRFGVDEARLRSTSELIASGGLLGDFERNGRRVRLRLAPDVAPRTRAEQLRLATVRASAAGRDGPIPLGLLGRVEHAAGPAVMRVEEGGPVGYVYAQPRAATDLASYVRRCQAAVDSARRSGELRLGPGERIEWAGQYQLLVSGWRRLAVIAPLVLLATAFLLFWLFRSWTEAAIVLSSLPLSLIGSVWMLFVLGYRVSAPVWIGVLSVVGLSLQTAVVMAVYLDEAFYRRVREGKLETRDDIVAAHVEGSVQRLRPKLMTVTTMVAGLLPLLWADGPGAAVLRRVAAPMLGGVLTSAFLTLEVIPVLYTLWRGRQLRRALRRGVPIAELVGGAPPTDRLG